MVYCNNCEYFEIMEDDYLCCRIGNRMRIGFNMDDLNMKCPKRKIFEDGVYVYKKE